MFVSSLLSTASFISNVNLRDLVDRHDWGVLTEELSECVFSDLFDLSGCTASCGALSLELARAAVIGMNVSLSRESDLKELALSVTLRAEGDVGQDTSSMTVRLIIRPCLDSLKRLLSGLSGALSTSPLSESLESSSLAIQT